MPLPDLWPLVPYTLLATEAYVVFTITRIFTRADEMHRAFFENPGKFAAFFIRAGAVELAKNPVAQLVSTGAQALKDVLSARKTEPPAPAPPSPNGAAPSLVQVVKPDGSPP